MWFWPSGDSLVPDTGLMIDTNTGCSCVLDYGATAACNIFPSWRTTWRRMLAEEGLCEPAASINEGDPLPITFTADQHDYLIHPQESSLVSGDLMFPAFDLRGADITSVAPAGWLTEKILNNECCVLCPPRSAEMKTVLASPIDKSLKEIAEDPLLCGRMLPTRLQVLAQRMARHGWTTPGYPQEGADHESEEGQEALLRNGARPSLESEAGRKPASDGSLRIPKEGRTVRIDRMNEVRTVPRVRTMQNLGLPERFLRLKDEQQAGALVALQQVDETQRQAVLDEWAARCGGSAVRNPAGYLFGIIQKALRGEFKAWAGTDAAVPPAPRAAGPAQSSSLSGSRPADREVARAYLARLRSALRDP